LIRNNHVFVACRSNTELPKRNIEEHLCPSWYLVCPSRLHGDRDGADERSPIILGRPFLNASGAVIYASVTKINFNIKGRKETFFFKNKTAQISEQPQYEPKKRNKSKKQVWTELAKMVTAVYGRQGHRLKSPFLIKKDDPGVPRIECSINEHSFQKTLCDTGSGVNIMAVVTYQLLYRTMPLQPTYIQLQMADQTFQKVEGIVTDVPI